MVIYWKSNNPPLKISHDEYEFIITAIELETKFIRHPKKNFLIAIDDISHID